MSRVDRSDGSAWSGTFSNASSSSQSGTESSTSRLSRMTSVLRDLLPGARRPAARQSNESQSPPIRSSALTNRTAAGNSADIASMVRAISEMSVGSDSAFSGSTAGRSASRASTESLALGMHRDDLGRGGIRPSVARTPRSGAPSEESASLSVSRFSRTPRPASATRTVDYSSHRVESETISERGQSLSTSALDLCTGVAVGGVRRHPDRSVAASSVSVFHALPGVRAPGVAIAREVNRLRSEGYEVSAHIAGGDSTSSMSRQQRDTLQSMLDDMQVPCGSSVLSNSEFASASRYSQYLTADIQRNGEVAYRITRDSDR